MKASKRKVSSRKAKNLPKPSEIKGSHSILELYWHDLAAIIGIGIIVVPILAAYLSSYLSMFLVLFIGVLSMVLATMLFDIETLEGKDPYRYLSGKLSREYAFIFGFLLLIAMIIGVIIASEIGVLELSQFFGQYGLYVGLIIIELFLISAWIVLAREREKSSLNILGIIKLLFAITLVIVGIIAVFHVGMKTFLQAFTSSSTIPNHTITGIAASPITVTEAVLSMVLLFWSFVGFETGSFVYKGDKSKRYVVAEAIMYSVLTAVVIYTAIQVFAYGLGISISNPFNGNVLFPNFLGGLISYPVEVGLSIFTLLVVMGSIIALSNNASKILHAFAEDAIVPGSFVDNINLKLALALGIPVVLLPIISLIAGPLSPNLFGNQFYTFLSLIAIASMSVLLAYAFLGIAMAYNNWHTSRSKVFSGLFVALLLFGLIGLSPLPFIVGALVILALASIGYVIVARSR